jgi:hypothetical protein
MRGSQPAERIWTALKQTAATERGTITREQAIRRVRKIVARAGMGNLPEPALYFYAEEYVRMVRET